MKSGQPQDQSCHEAHLCCLPVCAGGEPASLYTAVTRLCCSLPCPLPLLLKTSPPVFEIPLHLTYDSRWLPRELETVGSPCISLRKWFGPSSYPWDQFDRIQGEENCCVVQTRGLTNHPESELETQFEVLHRQFPFTWYPRESAFLSHLLTQKRS